MLQIVCSDTWADKDRCCELPALVGSNKVPDTGPVSMPVRVIDGLSRPMLIEMKTDYLDEVARGLNQKVPQAFGGRPRSLIYSYSNCPGPGHVRGILFPPLTVMCHLEVTGQL